MVLLYLCKGFVFGPVANLYKGCGEGRDYGCVKVVSGVVIVV